MSTMRTRPTTTPAPVGTTRDLLARMRYLEQQDAGDWTSGTGPGGRNAHYRRLEELRAIRGVLRFRHVGGMYVTPDM